MTWSTVFHLAATGAAYTVVTVWCLGCAYLAWCRGRDAALARRKAARKAKATAAAESPYVYLYFDIEARETPRSPEEQAILDARAKARQDLDRQIAEDHHRWLVWREIEDLTA